MVSGWPQRRTCGAILGLVALYAVLLQAFLANAAPEHVLQVAGILCSDHGGSAPPDGAPDHRDHACCTLAHPVVPPTPGAVEADPRRPFPPLAVAHPRPEADIPRTGPPTHAHSARGPPLA